MSDARATVLFELARRLNEGEITKEQMLQEIQALAKKNRQDAADTSSTNKVPAKANDDKVALVERLIKEKRQERSQRSEGNANDTITERLARMTSNASYRTRASGGPLPSHDVSTFTRNIHNGKQDRDRRHSAGGNKRGPVIPEATAHRRGSLVPEEYNLNTSMRHNTSRIEKVEEEVRRKRQQELTFKPKINEKRNRRGERRPSFLEKQDVWQRRREDKVKKKQENQSKQVMHACSFAPKINKNTPRAKTQASVTDRLYQASQKRKEREIEARQKDDADFQEACPFQPRINKRSKKIAASPRYMSAPKQTRVEDPEMENATFHPTINRQRRSVGAARKYLDENAFERLSKARSIQGNGAKENAVNRSMDQMSRRNSISSVPSTPVGRKQTPKKKDFNAFLRRQQDTVKRRRTSVANILKEEAGIYSHQPQIKVRSRDIASTRTKEDGTQETFFDRVEASAQRAIDAKKPRDDDIQYDFTPKILKASQRRKPRSVDDLSRGDQQRRKTVQSNAKQKTEEERLVGATFKPQLNANRHYAEGKVRTLSEPETYVERLQEEQRRREERVNQFREQVDELEVERCTFHPVIHPAPHFIKRIASWSRNNSTRTRRASLSDTARPEWR